MKIPFSSVYKADREHAQFQIGRVFECNPAGFTADVQVDGIGTIAACPILNLYGPEYGRDLTWLQNLRGAKVVLINTGCQYCVLGTMPEQIADGENLQDVPSAGEPGYGGDNRRTYGKGVMRDFSSGRPRDIMPGDKVIRTEEGAELSLLRGGLVRLKASALAQIILGRLKDFVRIIARHFQLYTDFGEIEFTHDSNGRVGMHLKGGADFASETHPGQGNFTVQVWAGNCPGGDAERFRVTVNDAAGANEVSVAFDTSGNMNIDVAGNKDESVQGNSESVVGGDKTESVTGASSENVTGGKTISAGGAVTISSAVAVTISAPSVNIANVVAIEQGGSAVIDSPVTFNGHVTLNAGITGDNT